MNRVEYEKLKFDFTIKTFVQEEQFYQWLKNFFFLNNELRLDYNSIYQDKFYVVFYELLTVGVVYAHKVFESLKKGDNTGKTEWYKDLNNGLKALKAKLSDDEFDFVEYKRHNACHIFQNHYETQILANGKIKKERKGKNIDELSLAFKKILLKHGSDKNFDIYLTQKLHPLIEELFNCLQNRKQND